MVFVFGGVMIGIVEQFGDLSASMIKRRFGVKDYGNALPGHGGFLDRIDGILFAFAAIYLYFSLFL
jgi:phosphatidate cytidylyltransferase